MNDSLPTSRAGLVIVLMLAFAVRLAWGLSQPADIDARLPDQAEYLQLGRNLLHNHECSLFDARFRQEVRAYRTPGYPALIAACGGNVRVLRAVQALIDTSTVLAAFLLARRWLTPGASLTAAIFVAVNPFLIYFSGLVLSETLFTAMLIWGLVLLLRVPGYFFGGAVLALSILVRPSAIVLPVMLGCLARALCPPPAKPGGLVPVGLGMLLLTAAAVFPWALRNRVVLGEWIWLTTNNGITRYDGFNPNATGASDQSFLTWPELRFLPRLNEVERDRALSRLADDFIRRRWRQSPAHLVRLTLMKIARTWSPVPLSSEFGTRRLYLIAAIAYALPFYLTILAGISRGKLPASSRVLLVVPALYFTIVHAASVGSLRYRIPVEPILAVLAAAGIAWMMQRLSPRNQPTNA